MIKHATPDLPSPELRARIEQLEAALAAKPEAMIGLFVKQLNAKLADEYRNQAARIERLEAAAAMALDDLEQTYCHVSSVSADRIKSTTIPALRAALAGKEET